MWALEVGAKSNSCLYTTPSVSASELAFKMEREGEI
jgi:hypothetical protein